MNQISIIQKTNEHTPTQLMMVPLLWQEGGSWVEQQEPERGDLLADLPGSGTTSLRAGGRFSSTLQTLRVSTCRLSHPPRA